MNQDLVFQSYLIIFLDVLGQRDALRQITALSSVDSEIKGVTDLVRKSIERMLMIRNSFSNFFEAASSHVPNLSVVPPRLKEEFLTTQRADVNYYGLSDSLVIAVPLMSNDDNRTALSSVYGAFVATAGIGSIALSVGVAVRAGLDVGIATQIGKSEIYGPALERAYYLESQLTEYPRFLIGNELLNYLNWVERQQPPTRLGFVAEGTVEFCRKMIVRDTDGRFMLDFLGEKFKEASEGLVDKQVVMDARAFVLTQYHKYLAENNDKLASRYYRLKDYFESRQDVWGMT